MISMEYFRKIEKESFKILKSNLDVSYDYLMIILAMIAVLVGGMEVTSGSFECVPVVNCRNIANKQSNASWPQANLKFSSICKKYNLSQTTSFAERTEVVTDQNFNCLYKRFVNSEHRKSVIPKYLSYLWLILFLEALWLLILDNFWLKIPLYSSVIETFVDLVMTCYDSPFPKFEVTYALFQLSGVIVFWKCFRTIQFCRKQNKYDFSKNLPQQSKDQRSDVDPIGGDLGFLLHLLDSYSLIYVIIFAHFLSKENEKKIDAHSLNIKFPVSILQSTVEKEQKLSFSTLPGIPQTIFDQLVKVLRLDNNKLQTFAPNTLTKLENLESLDIDGNHKLEMDALREILACATLRNLEYPFHLKERVVDELNETENEKLNCVNSKKLNRED
ncbi:volume-regulated anion channel subunit LRRC8A-like [Xenia sp. Carnegie-2017]|uniref:volume-regulated anion channel subunit LRRC8A-like n=1 Tax=Xenia sp. Carnegie-2017 TaxID=2897299 RepID=UPI001F047D27|nr:volume-regulated anion channel subunit LRRC8A-like [Xenia sp. Carnegie-2017]